MPAEGISDEQAGRRLGRAIRSRGAVRHFKAELHGGIRAGHSAEGSGGGRRFTGGSPTLSSASTGLDGPGSFNDADVWSCILEGTAETAVAEAQAKAQAGTPRLACGTAGRGSAIALYGFKCASKNARMRRRASRADPSW